MNKKYWKGVDELNETPAFLESKDREFATDLTVDEFLAEENLKETSTPRRDFLKFLGFSVAAATIAACEAPVVKAVPYVNKPQDVTPGMATWYASTYYDGNSYASILVKTREGRPIFIKGNKDHGITGGAVNPQIIGSVLPLYDNARLTSAMKGGEAVTTANADKEIKKSLDAIIAKGGKVVLVSNTLASPSTYGVVDTFRKYVTGSSAYAAPVAEGEAPVASASTGAQFDHIQYDAISYAGIRKANEATFGQAIIPDYDFTEAKTIVSLGADFMSTWLLGTQFASQYAIRRNPDGPWMSKHFQFESVMSISGTNADYRAMMKPSEEAAVLATIIKGLGGSVSGVSMEMTDDLKAKAAMAVKSLKENKNHSLIISGSNNVAIQTLVNKANDLAGSYNKTINLNNPINLFMSEDDKMMAFAKQVESGKGADAVIFYGSNPAYSLPNGDKFSEGLTKIGLSVSLNQYADETSSKCQYILPDHHALESWNDYSPKASEYAIAQPTIRPLHDTCSAQESLLVWAGEANRAGKDSTVYMDVLKENWNVYGFATQNEFADFNSYWNMAVHNSVMPGEIKAASAMPFNGGSLSGISKNLPKAGDLEVVLYQKAGIGNGSQANNPWLQELPDPVSKVTWDNYITMNPSEMEGTYAVKLDQENWANMAKVTVNGKEIELPVYGQPGQALGTIGIALGYGRGANGENIGKSAFQTKEYGGHDTDENGGLKAIGKNASPFIAAVGGTMSYTATGTIEKVAGTYAIASTQIHHTVMGRHSIVKETTLDIYNEQEAAAYNPPHMLMKVDEHGHHVEAPVSEFDLWDAHPVENIGHRWGMTIDLSSCIGCGSCLVACQSENNVPVVGKDEVRRGREMHWLRLDRYYSSDEEAAVGLRKEEDFDFAAAENPSLNPKVVHMPMMCQHCNHAPCETVCPVAATTHSNEGLNQMTYNRCIGTRYCANNCPYKVRRFNWFNYPSYKKFTEVNPAQDDLGRMVLNPDVTVRTRGVMEKCSFCVQKIQAGKLVAKKEHRPVADGDVTTACSDVCPTNAITVGDWNDSGSAIRKSADDKRSYQALEEIGVKPNIWYKVKVRNEENTLLDELQVVEAHGGHQAAEGHDGGHSEGHEGHGEGHENKEQH